MSLRLDTTSKVITAYAGAALLRETARAVGLDTSVSQHVHLKDRARGLSEAQFVVSMAESIALGARCLDDLAIARGDLAQRELRGFAVPAPQTAGTWLRRFNLGHLRQLDKALESVHRRAFSAMGLSELTLDFDSTYVYSRSTRRQGVDRTYKRAYALHPMLCFEANTGIAVHARLRRGRSGPSTGIDTFVRETLRRVPAGVALRSRLDSGFYSSKLFAQLDAASVTYLCSVPLVPAITGPCAQIADEYWQPCLNDDGEVAEFGYRLRKGPEFLRYVVKRIKVEKGGQLSFDTGFYRYWVLVTNDHERSALELESEHRHKADVEAGMRELKSNFGLHAFRKHGFMANWAWLELVCLGHNLCCWTQLLGHLGAGRAGERLRAKRLRYRFLAVPAMVTHSGRRLTLRLPEHYAFLDRFRTALSTLQALPTPTS
ncbi:MAG: IS1380 family transposase [Acidimicrobiales bacterium]